MTQEIYTKLLGRKVLIKDLWKGRNEKFSHLGGEEGEVVNVYLLNDKVRYDVSIDGEIHENIPFPSFRILR